MISYDDVFRIGKIGKPHGVKGEVTMHIDDDVFDRTDADYVILSIDGTLVPFFFEEYRFRTDETVLVKFTDIDTTDEARRLTGCEVYFERSKSQAEESNELSWRMSTYQQLTPFSRCAAAKGRISSYLPSMR